MSDVQALPPFPEEPLEIEVRFLCLLPRLPSQEAKRIRQGYLKTGDPSIRVRRAQGRYTLTRKSGRGKVRGERERPLEAEAGEILLEAAGERWVEKVRHLYQGFELDVFDHRHRGLVLLERELGSAEEALPPLPEPLQDSVLFEVTELEWLNNANLSLMGEEEAQQRIRALYRSAGLPLPEPDASFLIP